MDIDSLTVKTLFQESTQGYTGLVTLADGQEAVFKVPKNQDHTVRHEYLIAKELEDKVGGPHWCRAIDLVRAKVSPDTDPFNSSRPKCDNDILLYEYASGNTRLTTLIKSSDPRLVYTCIIQTMAAIYAGQIKVEFRHNDPHTDNILVRRCNENVSMLYIYGDGKSLLVPTHGVVPIVIDYGYSGSSSIMDKRQQFSLEHTDSGYTPHIFDPRQDFRKLLIGLTFDGVKPDNPNRESYKDLRSKLRKWYGGEKIKWDTGWDKDDDHTTPLEYLECILENVSGDVLTAETDAINAAKDTQPRVYSTHTPKPADSILFRENKIASQLLFSMICLPYVDSGSIRLKDILKTFTEEFIKIERQSSLPEVQWFLLRTLIDSAYATRELYIVDTEAAYKLFWKTFHETVDRNVEIFSPEPEVNYPALYISLMTLPTPLSTVTYRINEEIQARFDEQCHPFSTSWGYLSYIHCNYIPSYSLTEDTVIRVVDHRASPAVETTIRCSKLDYRQLKALNKLSSIKMAAQLTAIYDSQGF